MTEGWELWVNKRSGVGHAHVACRWIIDVPMSRLRYVVVDEWPPKLRLCPTCFPHNVPPSPPNRAVAPDGGVSPERSGGEPRRG